MLETRAVVVKIDGGQAQVRASRANGCSLCNGKGCGSGKLSTLFCSKPRDFRVDNQINANVGDEVIVSVAEGAVLRGIGLVYLLPLLLLVVGGVIGSTLASDNSLRDLYAAAGSFIGLAGGFILSKWMTLRKPGQQNLPYIARRWCEE